MTSAVLELADVHVRIGGSHILQGVSFDVPRGGVTALLGRNGVGKSTTVKAVLGLVPRTGTIRLDGADISGQPTHHVVRRGVGYVPEDRDVFAGLTVADNLTLAERPGSAHHRDLVHELFPELLTRAGQKAGTLSGGQQQMVAIARALLNDNVLLLVDEPTKGLSPLLVSAVADAVARAATVTTILLVEQNLAFVRTVAQRAVVLDQGRVVHSGSVEDLLDDPSRTRELLGVGSAGLP